MQADKFLVSQAERQTRFFGNEVLSCTIYLHIHIPKPDEAAYFLFNDCAVP